MHFVLIAAAVLALLFGPQMWAKQTFRRYAAERSDIPGTGGELARHLLTRFGIDVAVETTDGGDHYDPDSRTLRLTPANHDGHSITAVAVAAHEVGHAIQHHRGESLLATRARLVRLSRGAERVGAMALVALPFVTFLTKAPASGFALLAIVLLSMGTATLVHLVTLPVEWDASFGKAMPILEGGDYITAEQRPAVRRVLRAAALTYVAASLASLLNLGRWLLLLRRR